MNVFQVPLYINICGQSNQKKKGDQGAKFLVIPFSFCLGGGDPDQPSEVMFARVSFAASGCPATAVQLPQVPG